MKDDHRKELEEAYERLSRTEKMYVLLYALSRVIRHRIRQIPIRWLLFQIRIDMSLIEWRQRGAPSPSCQRFPESIFPR